MTVTDVAQNANKYDTVGEWVSAIADASGKTVDEEMAWDLAEKLLREHELDNESMEHVEKELRLKTLYEIHINRAKRFHEGTPTAPASWITVNFTVDETKHQIQFSYGSFSVTFETDEFDVEAMKKTTRDVGDNEAMKKITREEDMEVTTKFSNVMVTDHNDRGPVWGLRVTKRILNEVYGASLGDLNWAKEEGDCELTWEEAAEYL